MTSAAAAEPLSISVRGPAPSDEEMAAIAAAVELAWPRPQSAVIADPPMRWRFSGRWWSKPVPSRRDRPS
jgi:hypothetical protein